MSIVKMSKVSLAGDIEDKEKIISKIMDAGVVEIIDCDSRNSGDGYEDLLETDSDSENAAKLESDMAWIGSVINLVERYRPEKLPMFSSGRDTTPDEYQNIINESDSLWEVAKTLSGYEDRQNSLRAEENRNKNTIESLRPWKDLPIPLETTGTKYTRFIMGVFPSEAAATEAKETLLGEAPESIIEIVSADKTQCCVYVVYFAELEESVQQILKQYGFSRIQFKDLTGTTETNINDLQKRLKQIEDERNRIDESVKTLATEKKKLQVLYDYLQIRCDRKRIVSKFGKSVKVFFLEGWIPSHLTDSFLEQILTEFTCFIEIAEPEKGEPHPILLKNPKLIQPFEPITEMYSLPSVNDVDPNTVLAPFYFIFFGLMIGDFGYGLILSILTGIILLKFKPKGMAGKMMTMLCFGGISTAFWGMVFGSYFGNLPQVFMSWTTGNPEYKEKFYGLWFDTLSNPMQFLIFAMTLGGIHLFAGMGVKMYMLIKDKKVFEAIFDIGSWYVLIIGIVLMMVGFGGGMYIAALGALMLVCTQGRDKKNPIMKFLSGLLSLYSITSYLGDVLSYSRLLALGLGTGVIAAVINTLATMSPPGFISFVVFTVVLAVGTAFNLAINALGAFVHSSRLQYVEFFSKFYEGGGEGYKPFKIKTKYINIIGGKES